MLAEKISENGIVYSFKEGVGLLYLFLHKETPATETKPTPPAIINSATMGFVLLFPPSTSVVPSILGGSVASPRDLIGSGVSVGVEVGLGVDV